MTEKKMEVATGLSVIAVTKYLMKCYSVSYEEAYRMLIATEFFNLLNNPETGLNLEPANYLCEACRLELEDGKDAMYNYINFE